MRKNWKVSLVGIVLMIAVLFCACGCNVEEKTVKEEIFMEKVGYCGYGMRFTEYRDNETGVNYLEFYNGGICPRYNADGILYVD